MPTQRRLEGRLCAHWPWTFACPLPASRVLLQRSLYGRVASWERIGFQAAVDFGSGRERPRPPPRSVSVPPSALGSPAPYCTPRLQHAAEPPRALVGAGEGSQFGHHEHAIEAPDRAFSRLGNGGYPVPKHMPAGLAWVSAQSRIRLTAIGGVVAEWIAGNRLLSNGAEQGQLASAALLFTFFFGNVGILALTRSNRVQRPSLVGTALILAALLLSLAVLFALGELEMFWAFALVSVFFFGMLVYMRSGRQYRQALQKAENTFFPLLHALHLMSNASLAEMLSSGTGDAALNLVENGLEWLSERIGNLLKLDPKNDRSHVTILLAQEDFSFKVASSRQVDPRHLREIPRRLKWGINYKGFAGRAIANTIHDPDRAVTVVNDFDDQDNEDAQYWLPLSKGHAQPGSMLALPIFEGVGLATPRNPLAVLTVTSARKQAFSSEAETELLVMLSPLIESFIYLARFNGGFK